MSVKWKLTKFAFYSRLLTLAGAIVFAPWIKDYDSSAELLFVEYGTLDKFVKKVFATPMLLIQLNFYFNVRSFFP